MAQVEQLELLNRQMKEFDRALATVLRRHPDHELFLSFPGIADFDALLREHPAVDRFVLLALAEEVRRMTDQLSEALFDPVDKRVCRRLLLLHELAAADDVCWIRLRQEDIATLAGTTRPTVNRLLRRLQADRIIVLGRGGLSILDPDRLQRLTR